MHYFKLVVLVHLLAIEILADTSLFDNNCKNCHFASRQLDMFMARYTLKYSSESKIKEAIFQYLKDPKKETSVMPTGFLNRFGIKDPSTLNETELKNSIEQYYNIYNLKNRIK
ncbi:MAG: hypothetical protein PHV52_08550 [Aliarcobacter sp.]|jgi:hypothetical protein|nr:hypothetical protein [Aliarcobacter sp.]